MPTTRVYFCLARESNVTEASLTFNKTKDLDSKSKNLIYFSMYNLNVNIGLHYTIKTAIGIHWSFNLRSSIGNYNLTWSTIILIALFFLQGKSLHGEAICDHPMICIWLLFFSCKVNISFSEQNWLVHCQLSMMQQFYSESTLIVM